jgi:predicted transcriptional regulator
VKSVKTSLVDITAEIVSAYVSNNKVEAEALPEMIRKIHGTLETVYEESGYVNTGGENRRPAVPINESIGDDYIICLEDGQSFKSLKRHLKSHYNLSPEEYRIKWGLPADYPMVAPNYAERRSQLAKQIGLGHTAKVGRKKKATDQAA